MTEQNEDTLFAKLAGYGVMFRSHGTRETWRGPAQIDLGPILTMSEFEELRMGKMYEYRYETFEEWTRRQGLNDNENKENE